jgi:type III restriction enzyme
MKLQFTADLAYQLLAIDSVVQLLDGLPKGQSSLEIGLQASQGLQFTEMGLANHLDLPPEQFLENLTRVQQQNQLEVDTRFQAPDFSIEMETGTGKTYVYLRTILSLAQTYGLRKFIVVVPSVAIREGVLKSIAIMEPHFKALFPDLVLESFVYESRNLSRVAEFARSNQVQLMVINIQAFIKDLPAAQSDTPDAKKLNVIYRPNDRMQGFRPIDFIQATRPVVVVDEPQNLTSDKAKNALQSLNPSLILRYSATHREVTHLVYRLDPIRAYDLKLVKRIEVASVRSDENLNQAYVRLLQTDHTKGIRAQIEIHEQTPKGIVKPKKIWVKQDDNLFHESGDREFYRHGYIVRHIDCRPENEYIEFTNSLRATREKPLGSDDLSLMQAQIRETIVHHLTRERTLCPQGIKVLSLFFIDRVSSYRIYHADGTTQLGHLGQYFEQAYRQLTEGPNARFPEAAAPDLAAIHNGYFSKDKKGHFKDTNGTTRDDEDTYSLIMRDKERLLDLDQPLRFIFSHSALREGWDNPNVFQVCTLNETQSAIKKRQEIGRGLRLPVNREGVRIQDERICRLTVIANESYDDFARSLQKELEQDLGIKFGQVSKYAFAHLLAPQSPEPLGTETSRRIWETLVRAKFLEATGKPTDRFDPNRASFREDFADQLPDDLKPLAAQLIDVVSSHTIKGRTRNTNSRQAIRFRKECLLNPDFQALWERISPQTHYRVQYQTEVLIRDAANNLRDTTQMPTIRPLRIATRLSEVEITRAGVSADRTLAAGSYDYEAAFELPDLLLYLQNQTHLTRKTILEILKASGRLGEFLINPQLFMQQAAQVINRTVGQLALTGLVYIKSGDLRWDMRRLEEDYAKEVTRYLQDLYEVRNTDKAYVSHIDTDSQVEIDFARDLDNNERVAFFCKLPRWFVIDTPVGDYNPDWAFVTRGENQLFFVRETKSTNLTDTLRPLEKQKIDCGRKHFDVLGVDFDVATRLSDVPF